VTRPVADVAFPPGANLPWQSYGGDFGANAWQPGGGLASGDRSAQLEPQLELIADNGACIVRWFLLCDGRAGLRLDSDGRARGLDGFVLRDVDAALRLLDRHRLQGMFVLTDFNWFKRPQVVNGVRMFGKRSLVKKADRCRELLDLVVTPLLEHFAKAPQIHSWDVLNEPEWAVLGLGTVDPRAALLDSEMRAYLADLVGCVRAATRHPVTVGLASPRGLGLVRTLELDFYQWHWYDSVEKHTPLTRPVAQYGVDRPVLLGEFPTRGSARGHEDIRLASAAAGYAAAWPWSVLATDASTDRLNCAKAIASQARRA
jgi:hypothetical protein